MKTVIAVLIAIGSLVLGGGVANAHSALNTSEPASDAQLTDAPTQVVLSFNQTIEPSFAFIGVTSDDGRQWARPEPTVDGQNVRVELVGELPDGRYTVAYRVVSQDGHPIEGSYVFDLSSAKPASADAAAETSIPTASSQASGVGQSRSDSGSASIWILAAAAAGLLVAGAYSLWRRWWPAKSDHEHL